MEVKIYKNYGSVIYDNMMWYGREEAVWYLHGVFDTDVGITYIVYRGMEDADYTSAVMDNEYQM